MWLFIFENLYSVSMIERIPYYVTSAGIFNRSSIKSTFPSAPSSGSTLVEKCSYHVQRTNYIRAYKAPLPLYPSIYRLKIVINVRIISA